MNFIRVYRGNDLKTQFELAENRVTIGRTQENSLVLADDGVSKQHAAIEFEDGEYYIVDLGSSNGVFLNSQKVQRHQLKFWDEIQIHNFVIKFMAKPGYGVNKKQEDMAPLDLEEDKTKVFNLSDEKQLDDLRKKTKECFLMYTDQAGDQRKPHIKKPRIVIGKSNDSDIQLKGWFAPAIAATIERQGSIYELVPTKRGKVLYKNQPISEATKLVDGSKFRVRNTEFTFFNRLIKTS